MYLVDTNVISMLDPKRSAKATALVEWLKRNGASIYLSVITIAELEAGVLKLRRTGKDVRADEIAALIAAILSSFADHVLVVDIETSQHLARLGERTHKRTIELPDLILAATAARHGLTLLTRNLKHLGSLGIPARDPFVDLPADV